MMDHEISLVGRYGNDLIRGIAGPKSAAILSGNLFILIFYWYGGVWP
jgi:hypothetical protein